MTAPVLLLATVWLAVGDAPKDDVKKELDQAQGIWKLESMLANGMKVSEENVRKYKMTIKGDKATIMFGEQKLGEATVKLDPKAKPKTVDFVSGEGPQKGMPVGGIYKLDGDKLTLCRAFLPGKPRPTEFSSAINSGLMLAVWKRDKKE